VLPLLLLTVLAAWLAVLALVTAVCRASAGGDALISDALAAAERREQLAGVVVIDSLAAPDGGRLTPLSAPSAGPRVTSAA
jgi:hypothetical protein